ncbi:MAG: 4-hydroxy-tetrahydrodipicolinate reductase [Desulfovibrionaceae bacterium]|nr:4-hydroxy-tetrahydrodipicolinate reductase [Desulfovibrionaceae bacterium]
MAQAKPILVVGANGRMGRTICDLVLNSDDFTLAGCLDSSASVAEVSLRMVGKCPVSDNLEDLIKRVPSDTVMVDFTAPKVSMHSAKCASEAHLPLVIGTTGFSKEDLAQLEELAKSNLLFWSSNMSIGISVMRKLLPELAKALGPQYDLEIMEIHHKHKKDAPSGTALTLAEGLAKARGWEAKNTRISSRDGLIGERPCEQIGVQALRGGDVVGVHTVYFLGPGERIEVTHQAHSRENFARGALRACEWLPNQQPGKLYSMPDLLA